MDKIPFIAFESALARCERTIKRLIIVIIALIGLLVATNVLWTIYENQFEDVTTTVTQELEGDNSSNSFIGGDYYGESKTDSNS